MKPLLAERARPESEEKSPIWLIVLCDMMTILMLFFLMMFSYTYQPEKREEFEKVFAVQGIIRPPEAAPSDAPAPPPPPDAAKVLKDLLAERGLEKTVEIVETEDAIRVRLKENILFKTAGADLAPSSAETLGVLAGALRELPNEIVVEGHTDDVAITKARYRSNWELSVARSYAVIERLVGEGVAPERLVAAGYGEFHPAADNATRDGRSRNRRVELVILREGEG